MPIPEAPLPRRVAREARRLRSVALVLLLLASCWPLTAADDAHPAPDFARLAGFARPLQAPDLSVPALAALPLGTSGAGAPADCGGAGDAGNGAPLAVPADCAGSLGAGDAADVYAVPLDARRRLHASVEAPAGVGVVVCLGTPDGRLVRCGDAAEVVTNATGEWLVAVLLRDGAGAYRLVVDAPEAPPPAPDCDDADGADDPAQARPLRRHASCDGRTRLLDDVLDHYALPRGALRVDATATAPTLVCAFLAQDLVHPISCAVAGPGSPAAVYAGARRGAYVLMVFSPADASYHLDVSDAPRQDDCGSGADAPANLYLGVPIAGASCDGALTDADAADVLVARVPAGMALGATATFDPGVDAMLCVAPLPDAPFAPESCEVAWAGGAGVARAGAPAGEARDVLVYVVASGATAYRVDLDVHAPAAQDDCGTGADAVEAPASFPLDCEGSIVAPDGDVWDLYRVVLTEGPVHLDLQPAPGADFDLCLVDATFSSAACSTRGGSSPERLEVGWPAGVAYVAVVRYAGSGSYHLSGRQQDDCGTGADARLQPPAGVAAAFVRCAAELDPFAGDDQDAYSIPPPALPGLATVRVEPQNSRLRVCVVDPVVAAMQEGCTGRTFTRFVVARDPARPLVVRVEAWGVEPFAYTLVVEDTARHPPTVPPLL